MEHHKLPSRLSTRLFAAAAVLSLCASVNAYAIDYNVNISVPGGNGTVTGNITTDGTIGTLTPTSITDWSLTWTWNSAVYSMDSTNSFSGLGELGAGGKLQATASSLFMISSDTEDLTTLSFRQMVQPQLWFSVSSGGLTQRGPAAPSGFISVVLGGTSFVNIPLDFQGSQFTIGTVAAVPEPSAYALMGLGLLGVGAAVRRQRKAG